MKRLTYIFILILLAGCSPVPISILQHPPTNEQAPQGYKLYKDYSFNTEADRPPTIELDVCEVWGINHVCRKDGGMYNDDGTLKPADDPWNYCEWNPDQVRWVDGGYLNLVTDLNKQPNSTDVVSGQIATIETFMPPVYVAVRMRVAPKGNTYWTSFLSYSPNGWLPENDYMEFECETSKSFTSTIHRSTTIKGKSHQRFNFPVDLSEDFHIYACELWPHKYRIYLDNVMTGEFEMEGLNAEPIYFLVGNGIYQGCDTTLINDANKKLMFPQTVTVDYLRIYKP